jgi:hypothetical protein
MIVNMIDLAVKSGLSPNAPLSDLLSRYGVSSLRDALAAYNIQEHYRRLGGVWGDLGAPVGGLQTNTGSGYSQTYQLGVITAQDFDKVPIGSRRIGAQVTLAGIRCFGTAGAGSDELYAIISITNINPNNSGTDQLVATMRTPIQEGVKPGSAVFRGITLTGPATAGTPGGAIGFPGTGLRIHVALFEHDNGDPDELRDDIQAALEDAAKKGSAALAGASASNDQSLGGMAQDFVNLDIGGFKPFKWALGAVSGVLADILGDDLIGEYEFVVPAAVFQDWCEDQVVDENGLHFPRLDASMRWPSELTGGIGVNWPRENEEHIFDGEGASYKVYFQIVPILMEIPVLPKAP